MQDLNYHFSVSFTCLVYIWNNINLIIWSCILHCIVVIVVLCCGISRLGISPGKYPISDCYSTPMSIYHNGKWCIYGHDLHGSLPAIMNIIIRWWGHDHGSMHEVAWPLHAPTILGSQTKVVLAQRQHNDIVLINSCCSYRLKCNHTIWH